METIETLVEKGILQVRLNRPQARNALSRQMVAELQELVAQASADDSVRALVLRGAGGHFCAGADLADMASARIESGGDVAAMAAINRSFGNLISAVHECPKTVVAVVEGSVFGGGVGLACVADVCLVSRDTKIGLPEVTLGLPPAQIIPFVVGRVGLSRARHLALTGARIDGAEAFRIGMAHALADDGAALDQLLEQTLAQIQRCAPQASRMTKSLLLATADTPLNDLLDRGAREFAEAATGEEASEGTQAFLQKRPPNWSSVNGQP